MVNNIEKTGLEYLRKVGKTMKKTYKRILAATLASILVWNTCEWQPRALAGSKIYQIEEVKGLPESVLHQEVAYGTKYKDLELPDKLSMRIWAEEETGTDGEEDAADKGGGETIATPSQISDADEKSQPDASLEVSKTVRKDALSASPSEADAAEKSEAGTDDIAQKASPSEADGTKDDKNWKEVKVRWVLDETFSEKEKYDGKTPGVYVFDAELKSSRYELDTGFLPRIEVTVLPEEAAPEITEFFELEETIQVQNLALGAKESDIILPDTLDVQVENLDEGGADEADAATEDDKAVDGESTEETVGEEENVGDETASQYQLTGITWKLDEKQSDLSEFHGGISVQEYFDEFDEDGEPIESEEKTWAGYADANQEYNGVIHDQKIVRKRHFAIKSVLLVAALAAMSSILAIAHNYGAALIDDSNRHLVGKGLHGEGQIIGADEEIEVPDEPSDGIWETTARIKSYKNVSISPNSITEFAVSGDAGQYITPEIIFGNNDLVIFEQEDGSGWELNEGETLMIQATEYEAETNGGNGQGIMYFYICDGEILDGKSEPRKELNQTFELTAEKSGEYYICLLGVSSDPISLKEGKIVIK